jgi:hypothetical protein
MQQENGGALSDGTTELATPLGRPRPRRVGAEQRRARVGASRVQKPHGETHSPGFSARGVLRRRRRRGLEGAIAPSVKLSLAVAALDA